MEFLIGVLVIVALFIFFYITIYNRLVRLRQNVRESWSAIETELRRRFDLIPNLVEVVKGYASHERDTLEQVIKARNSAVTQVSTPQSAEQANSALSSALKQVFALSEAYPDLKANQNFQQLQQELGDTETRISQARRFYNANVRELNTTCESFPANFIAGSAGFRQEPYFGIDNADAFEPVKISGFGSSTISDQGQKIQITESQTQKDRE
jgi:LemA protein